MPTVSFSIFSQFHFAFALSIILSPSCPLQWQASNSELQTCQVQTSPRSYVPSTLGLLFFSSCFLLTSLFHLFEISDPLTSIFCFLEMTRNFEICQWEVLQPWGEEITCLVCHFHLLHHHCELQDIWFQYILRITFYLLSSLFAKNTPNYLSIFIVISNLSCSKVASVYLDIFCFFTKTFICIEQSVFYCQSG